MGFFQFIFQDWEVNKGNTKGRIFLAFFRAANYCSKHKVYFYLGIPYLAFYKIFIQWLYTLEIPWNLQVGKDFSIYHGQAVVLNKDVVIGKGCTIRQCTTIGVKQLEDGSNSAAPIIGDNVDIGSNVCIIGNIRIGNNVKIGCGSVVVKNVSGNSLVVGNPAVEKKRLSAII
jgi:putative colanic acid biosynthesis acetyltransferase WcaB